ncbi:MAG TPA: type II toxin-antitoxin system HicA family toxin [Leptolyngbya sp.]|jgi:predicted RNA binding protein YcfA (HicA-like mRNA interferase family)|nr:type II toxin-antitoxin system HicA family toxin [Leptolyngbya sp.]
MSKLSKLIELFLREPSEVRFEDICYVLTAFEFEEVRSRGSHHTFRNPEGLKITVPKKGGKMVKGVYVKQIIELLNLEEWQDAPEN